VRPWIWAFAGYLFSLPMEGMRDGPGRVDLVPGSAPRWFTRPKTVTHPGTNWAGTWCRVTTLIETSVLPLLAKTLVFTLRS